MERIVKKENLLPFKIWGFTLLIGAFFFFISEFFNNKDFFTALSFGFIALFLSLFLSIPAFLAYLIFSFVINGSNIKKNLKAPMILVCGLLLLVLTLIACGFLNSKDFIIIIGYTVALILSTFICTRRLV